MALSTSWIRSRAQEGEAKTLTAEALWERVEAASHAPAYPREWQTKRPTSEEVKAFRKDSSLKLIAAADLAKEFYTTYPQHAKATGAKQKELEMLRVASELGNDTVTERLKALEKEVLAEPNLSEDARFNLRVQAVVSRAKAKQPEGISAVFEEFETGVRELQKEFPKRDEIYHMLLEIAQNSEPEKAKHLAQEIVEHASHPQVVAIAKGMVKKFGMLGQPLDLKFTAIDGREVDVRKLKGKVVLIDFWATWCGPCVAELPNVKQAYGRLHPKGFEIVGISFDQSRPQLTRFVKREAMSWPQYFDGKGWSNEFGRKYGINAIPTMWLVDKTGTLRDMNGRENLEKKVEDLLAEEVAL